MVTEYAYDEAGRKVYEGGATYPVDYVYDEYGNRVSMTTYRDEEDEEGDTTVWDYDEASGLVTAKTYADGHGPTYTYTADRVRLSSSYWWSRLGPLHDMRHAYPDFYISC